MKPDPRNVFTQVWIPDAKCEKNYQHVLLALPESLVDSVRRRDCGALAVPLAHCRNKTFIKTRSQMTDWKKIFLIRKKNVFIHPESICQWRSVVIIRFPSSCLFFFLLCIPITHTRRVAFEKNHKIHKGEILKTKLCLC